METNIVGQRLRLFFASGAFKKVLICILTENIFYDIIR